jgi:hypothetical protein
MRTAIAWPGAARPIASSWWSEHAFNRMPRRTCSARRVDGIWELSWICPGAKPARSARSTSQSLEASMWRPRSRNSSRMRRLGFAFIA